ncbi:MAG: succinate dehydrogenase, hydrophobic membrane anchor protein [Nevskiales bacterium]
MSLRSPLGQARGLGTAKEGVEHWWVQRLTAVALIPLSLWFVFSVACLAGAEREAVLAWVAAPLNAVGLILFLVTLFHHSQLGVQVVIEDYIHTEFTKISLLVLVKFAHVALAVAAVFAVLKISLGA